MIKNMAVIPKEKLIRFEDYHGTLVIIYPYLPPSKNKYIRSHWASQQKRFFKPWRNWFIGEYVSQPLTRCFNGPVRVTIQLFFPDNRRRDAMNYASFPPLLDTLVEAKIIEDDNSAMCDLAILPPIVDGTSTMILTVNAQGK